MKKYYYSVFGINFQCDFKIEQVIEISEVSETDTEVRIAKMPQYILDSIRNNNDCYYGNYDYWFYIKNTAVFRIYNGKYIDIMPMKNGDCEDIKSYLLSGAFFLLMAQRKTAMLHGGVIAINNGAVLITGECGAGKSTLVTQFILSGYKYVSDDVGVVDMDHNIIKIKPGYPQQKLCRDTADKFGYNVKELIYINEERDKFAVRSINNFLNKSIPLKAVFQIVENHNITKVNIEKISGVNKIKCIRDNLYEKEISRVIGLEKKVFNVLLKIAKDIPCFKISRPVNLFTAYEQMEIIKKIVS